MGIDRTYARLLLPGRTKNSHTSPQLIILGAKQEWHKNTVKRVLPKHAVRDDGLILSILINYLWTFSCQCEKKYHSFWDDWAANTRKHQLIYKKKNRPDLIVKESNWADASKHSLIPSGDSWDRAIDTCQNRFTIPSSRCLASSETTTRKEISYPEF
jgi:hypothetical protein